MGWITVFPLAFGRSLASAALRLAEARKLNVLVIAVDEFQPTRTVDHYLAACMHQTRWRFPNMTRWLLPFLITAMGTAAAAAADAPRPNVLMVMTDDQGLGDFSFTGNPVLKTPHLDAFAKEAIRFTDFHVSPMCTPTRGQLMSGLSALRNGATSVTAGRTFLRPGLPTLPAVFAQAGYRTGLFGKWHLGDHYPHRPMDKGFHEASYHLGWGQLHSTPEFDWPLIDGRYFHNGVPKRYQGHCTDLWFDRAIAWMKECHAQNQPFFCYLATNAPHAPHIDFDEYIRPYQGKGPAGFFGMIAHIDKRFGDLEQFLVHNKLRDNTIVIFMTDNGGTAGVHIFNAGLRGRKTMYYEGGHRVPCWMRWPKGGWGRPRDIDTPTQNTDLFPTLCELCGIQPPQWPAQDEPYRGRSLVPLLRGETAQFPERKLVVQYGQTPKKFESCVIWGRWRLVHGQELYDIHADREQKTNLADQRSDILNTLREYYEQWWKGVEPLVNDFVPISIGSKQQPVVELNSGDWENIYADNSGHVRAAVGGPTGGKWHILVEEPGEYQFILRRWPEQTGAALGDKYEPNEKSPDNRPKGQRMTVAFPHIACAKIAIAGQTVEAPADPRQTSVRITAKLPAGKTTLQAWFADARGQDLCGAFYVTVQKK
ncbi:MAG: arylsulfatase [Gemmataceae bacterium]|nr:arylsulfatase [Gemmata sp.]MDW8198179.1 arylsulfatase [Gemmataceae bacterium]